MAMLNLQEFLKDRVAELRKNSAGYGFVTDESIKMFEEQFVIPIITEAYLVGAKDGASKKLDKHTRFLSKIKKIPGGCWEWQTSKSSGYGTLQVSKTEKCLAHRYSYTYYKGKIPEGFEVDHLCRNRACVNPDHLEAVSKRENILRSNAPSAIHAKKKNCPRCGGRYYFIKSGIRRCRLCYRKYMREFMRKKKELKGQSSKN